MPYTGNVVRLPTPSERAARAAEKLKAAGGNAMDCALESISVAFDHYACWYGLKLAVRSAIRRGPADLGNRTRFRRLVEEIERLPIERACAVIEEAARRHVAQGNVRHRGTLPELRLLLRHLRRYEPATWPEFAAEIVRPGWMPSLHLHPSAFVLDAPNEAAK